MKPIPRTLLWWLICLLLPAIGGSVFAAWGYDAILLRRHTVWFAVVFALLCLLAFALLLFAERKLTSRHAFLSRLPVKLLCLALAMLPYGVLTAILFRTLILSVPHMRLILAAAGGLLFAMALFTLRSLFAGVSTLCDRLSRKENTP